MLFLSCQILPRSGSWECRSSGRSARSRIACSPRAAVISPARQYLRTTCATSRSSRCGACGRGRKALWPLPHQPPRAGGGGRQPLMRRQRSTAVPFRSHRARRGLTHPRGGTLQKSRTHLGRCRPVRDRSHLGDEEIGQRLASLRRAHLEPSVEIVGHVSQLNHRWHVKNMRTCAPHVNLGGRSLPEWNPRNVAPGLY
jgi:hypothetical protein